MTKKTSDNKKRSAKSYLTWGASIGALAAGAAGAYFLYGTKEGAKRRKKMKSWAVRMKGDVMKKLENLKEVNEEIYNKVIDEVGEQYKKVKSIDPQEVADMVDEMKRYWKHVRKDLEAPAKKASSKKKTSAKKKAPAKKTSTKKKTSSKK
ncbi:MAG: hypothetical protein ACQEP6_02180 [Patescibacteria group bacterium]